MTENDAIKELETSIDLAKMCTQNYERKNEIQGYEMAIKALEKQIPKKPNIEGDGYADGQLVYDTWICPCCEKHYEIDYDSYDYCPNCGQHIDRSEIN